MSDALSVDLKRFMRTLATAGPMPRIFLPLVKGRGTIFMMHRFRDPENGVMGHDPSFLDLALQDLKRGGFRLVPLLELVRIALRGGDLSRTVAFAVDDGHADFHRIAAPVFLHHECPVTVFLTTDFVDGKDWLWPDRIRYMMGNTSRSSLRFDAADVAFRLEWHDEASRAAAAQDLTWAMAAMNEGRRHVALRALEKHLEMTLPDEVVPAFAPMTWSEVRRNSSRGVAFGPHSVSHPNMGLLTPTEVKAEILRSWDRLQSEVSGAIPLFCYPFGRRGDCPPAAAKILREAGFVAAVTATPGHVNLTGVRRYPFFLPRFPWPDRLEAVRQVVFGMEEAKAMVRSGGRRVPWPQPASGSAVEDKADGGSLLATPSTDASRTRRAALGTVRGTPRVLVVTYHFPPEGAVGGLRWAGFTKYLARAGWTVEVLAGGHVERPPTVEGVPVHSVRRRRTWNDRYREYVARRAKTRADGDRERGAPLSSLFDEVRRGPVQELRQLLSVSLNYPDHARGWVLRAARMARRLVKRDGIDVVVSSGPPHSAHFVAMLATVGTRAKWVMDMRDPWSEMTVAAVPRIFRQATRLMEHIAFTRADRVICNTQQYMDVLKGRKVSDIVNWVPNGVDLETLPAPVPSSAERLTLAYVGSLYYHRDLRPVVKSMDELVAGSSPAALRGVRLRIAGGANSSHRAALEQQIRESSLRGDDVEWMGTISRHAALQVTQEAHLSLVLAQEQPWQVPAKLYECVGMGVPTLVLTERGSASASEAERLGTPWCEPTDIQGIRSVIEKVANGEHPGPVPRRQAFDYQSLTMRLAELLKAM